MKTIYLQEKPTNMAEKPTVLVLGFFDGVHKGHQSVIKKGRQLADQYDYTLAVMSFDKHPSAFFQPHTPFAYLTNFSQKELLLKQLGVDIFYVSEFTNDFSKLTPQQFINDYILALGAAIVIAGFDYRFGKQAEGTVQTLKEDSRFQTIILEKEQLFDDKIGSTSIRQALLSGEVEKANLLLGRAYQLSGCVIHGDARGRTIGFPTANIQMDSSQLLPKEGVYVVSICVDSVWYQGMASIGRNITFEANRPVSFEVNIFDFNQTIYGQYVTVRFEKWLRQELKFASVDELIEQLKQDKQHALNYFKKEQTNG